MAESEDGPRGASPLTLQERNSYPNLILLCLEHHKVIDDDPEMWTVERLLDMKQAHEAWFESLQDPAEQRQTTKELILLDIITEWEDRIDLKNWTRWVSTPLGTPTPYFRKKTLDRLDSTRLWLFTRPWPGVHPRIETAFEAFRRIADDISFVVQSAFDDRRENGDLSYWPLHKQRLLSQEEYQRSSSESRWITDLMHDLLFELTRAANWILDEIRLAIDPRYQFDLGVLALQRPRGLGSAFYLPRYQEGEVETGSPYPGLRDFIDQRATRSEQFGEGFHDDGWAAITVIDL